MSILPAAKIAIYSITVSISTVSIFTNFEVMSECFTQDTSDQ